MEAQDLTALVARLRAFVAERDWAKFHDPKNLAMALGSEAGELLALFRWVGSDEADAHAAKVRPALEAEIADVAIALLLLCDRVGVDLAAAIAAKIEVNARNYPAELVRGSAERPPRGG